MSDLYEVLGVPRDIAAEDLKAAYLRAAKTAHPDQGGSAERFAQVKHAFDVLSDPNARAFYDQTGERLTDMTSNRLARAQQTLFQAVTLQIATADQWRRDYQQIDLLQGTKNVLVAHKLEVEQKKAQIEKDLMRKERLHGLFHAKDGKPNLIAAMITAENAKKRAAVSQLSDEIDVCELALQLADDHTYDLHGEAPQQTPSYTVTGA
jgi:curved DNA-binding protein CbpA